MNTTIDYTMRQELITRGVARLAESITLDERIKILRVIASTAGMIADELVTVKPGDFNEF